MNSDTTWIILTDGNFIKIMYNNDGTGNLKTFRDDDFEHTSIIAYKLVIKKRNQLLSNPSQKEEQYFLDLLVEFLVAQDKKNAFDKLVLIAPEKILGGIYKSLPAEISDKIKAGIPKDYLYLSQDKLQEQLADIVSG